MKEVKNSDAILKKQNASKNAGRKYKSIYDELHANRKNWNKAYQYEDCPFCTCADCIFFTTGQIKPFYGTCIAMARSGAESTVKITGVCDRFISDIGTDINGKLIIPNIKSGTP